MPKTPHSSRGPSRESRRCTSNAAPEGSNGTGAFRAAQPDHAALLDACRRGDAQAAAHAAEANFLRLGEQMRSILAAAE